jgi:hypothetical protein
MIRRILDLLTADPRQSLGMGLVCITIVLAFPLAHILWSN